MCSSNNSDMFASSSSCRRIQKPDGMSTKTTPRKKTQAKTIFDCGHVQRSITSYRRLFTFGMVTGGEMTWKGFSSRVQTIT